MVFTYVLGALCWKQGHTFSESCCVSDILALMIKDKPFATNLFVFLGLWNWVGVTCLPLCGCDMPDWHCPAFKIPGSCSFLCTLLCPLFILSFRSLSLSCLCKRGSHRLQDNLHYMQFYLFYLAHVLKNMSGFAFFKISVGPTRVASTVRWPCSTLRKLRLGQQSYLLWIEVR